MQTFLNVRTVARCLAISSKRVYQLIHEGELESMRVGTRCIRISSDSLDRYVKKSIRMERESLGLDLDLKTRSWRRNM